MAPFFWHLTIEDFQIGDVMKGVVDGSIKVLGGILLVLIVVAAIWMGRSDKSDQEVPGADVAQESQSQEEQDPQDFQVTPPLGDMPLEERRETRFGVFQVTKTTDGEQLTYNGEALSLSAKSMGLGPAFRYGDSDLLLIQMAYEGAACPLGYTLVTVRDGGKHELTRLGSCSDLYQVTERPGKLVVRIGDEAFFADGNGLRKVPVSEAVAEEASYEIDNPSTQVTNIFQPMVQPDMKMYRWCGKLERAELDDPKIQTLLLGTGNDRYWFVAASFGKFDILSEFPSLRLNTRICVTGRYLGNQEMKANSGGVQTVPVLSIFRLSD